MDRSMIDLINTAMVNKHITERRVYFPALSKADKTKITLDTKDNTSYS